MSRNNNDNQTESNRTYKSYKRNNNSCPSSWRVSWVTFDPEAQKAVYERFKEFGPPR